METKAGQVSLYDYQQRVVSEAIEKLRRYRFVYLAMDMRTGKTIVSLSIAKTLGCEKVLVIYPNRNVEKAFIEMAEKIGINIDTSSNHTDTIKKYIGNNYDCVIVDESHNFKAYPKPSSRAVSLRELVSKCDNPYIVLLSGTPHPEGYSDLYHQLWAVKKETHKNFYLFAREYVNVKEKRVAGGNVIKDYSDCSSKYYDTLKDYFIVVGREEAGIFTEKRLIIERVEMPVSSAFARDCMNKGVIKINDDTTIVVDSNAKELQVLRQLCGGVVYDNVGRYHFVDKSKCNKLKEVISRYKKTLVFYYYHAEREMLMRELSGVFTEDVEEAKNSDKHLLLQMVSGREGITFDCADAIVYYSIDYSAITYLQSQERATIRGKDAVDIVYLFSSVGLDEVVYKVLQRKKKYTQSMYDSNRSEILRIINKSAESRENTGVLPL